MAAEEHERLADELAREAEKLEDHSAELGDEIDRVRQDWRSKQNDPSVPGAVRPSEGTGGADHPDRHSST